MNLLHDIAAGTIDVMNVIVEIPKFSKNKYEIDKETGLIALDRVMHTAQDYCTSYYIPPLARNPRKGTPCCNHGNG